MMFKAIIGQKLGMTRLFQEKGQQVSVTVIETKPVIVTQIKNQEKDGYDALQIGYDMVEERRLAKPQREELKKKKLTLKPRQRVEVRLNQSVKEITVGQEVNVKVFQSGDKVMVIGRGKGKGFAGVVKRHGFARGPMSHGSHHHREPGSIGSMFPQRVVKGRKLPGHMGNERVTVKGLQVIEVDEKRNLLIVSGAVPGPNKSWVLIKSQNEKN